MESVPDVQVARALQPIIGLAKVCSCQPFCWSWSHSAGSSTTSTAFRTEPQICDFHLNEVMRESVNTVLEQVPYGVREQFPIFDYKIVS